MWKALALMGVCFLVLLTVLVLISIGLAKRQSGTPASSPAATVASDWARSMLQKYPYESGSYSGVLPTKNSDEIWIIGRKVVTNQYANDQHIGVKNQNGEYFIRIGPVVGYTLERGDELTKSDPKLIGEVDILFGDFVAVRTIFAGNSPLALEIRKLVRESVEDL